MTQEAYPDADLETSDYAALAGSDFYAEIDDPFASPDDASTYIALDPVDTDKKLYYAGLGNITDPDGAAGTYKFVIRGRSNDAYDMANSSQTEELIAKLTSGTDADPDNNTLISTLTAQDFSSTSWGNFTKTLSSADKTRGNNVSWANLCLAIYLGDVNTGGMTLQVTQAYFQCPDAAAAVTANPAFLLFTGM
jgi:hypothetical protein